MLWTTNVRHCGRCSQCIDRRFAVLAAEAAEFDPPAGYAVELLTGARDADEDVRMAVAYVKFWREMSQSSRQLLPIQQPDVYSAVQHVPGVEPDEVLDRAWDLLRRHAEAVNTVIERGIMDNSHRLARDDLPRGSLLRLCFSQDRIEPPPLSDGFDQVAALLDRLNEPVCDFAVDVAAERIWFRGDFHIDGVDYQLVEKLLPNHRIAKAKCREVPPFHTPDLADALQVQEQTLRKRITRCREVVEGRLAVDQGIVFANGFIENVHGEGYRLAPELREVSRADLRTPQGAMSQDA
jgi:hypothetical protein